MIDDPAVPMSYEPSGSAGDEQSRPDPNQDVESEALPPDDAHNGIGDQAEADLSVDPSTDSQEAPLGEPDPEAEADALSEVQSAPDSVQEPEPAVADPLPEPQDTLPDEPDSEEAPPQADSQDASSSEPDSESETPSLSNVEDTPSSESGLESAPEPEADAPAASSGESDADLVTVPDRSAQAEPKAGSGKEPKGKTPAEGAAQGAPGAMPEAEPAVMPLMQHLIELRGRLTWAVLALLITTGISFIFAKQVLILLIAPMGDSMPQALKPTESLGNYMKVALICGVTLAMPMIVYQIGAFLSPGLTKQEKRWLFLLVPGATLSFILGAAFAYFIMLPTAIPFLQGFMSDIIEQGWAIGEYLSFVTSLLFWIGLAFELPLFVFFLAKLGIVNVEMLTKNRKYAYLGIAVAAAVITPTVDPLNMMLVMAPLVVLYELGVILARIA